MLSPSLSQRSSSKLTSPDPFKYNSQTEIWKNQAAACFSCCTGALLRRTSRKRGSDTEHTARLPGSHAITTKQPLHWHSTNILQCCTNKRPQVQVRPVSTGKASVELSPTSADWLTVSGKGPDGQIYPGQQLSFLQRALA